MITFFISLLLLLVGYFVYGKFVERVFGANSKRETPAIRLNDGVDYVPMGWGKIYLIQFLNIAGLGPIFGAILGAVYGPVAFIWIVVGSILGGAVHDYFSGMMSVRQDGQSIAEVIGKYLGLSAKQIMRGFTVILMLLVGAAFMKGPAVILGGIALNKSIWIWIIFAYYIIATLLPINKLIGQIYPIFGLALLFMALGIGFMMIYRGLPIPELTLDSLKNMKTNGSDYPIFPMIFVTISCGAISGFHATQSPLMARCIKNEKMGRQVFYGSMITEAVVALIWAAVAMSFFGGVSQLNAELAANGNQPAWFVNLVSKELLGTFGGVLAILGVVAAPITTGDTAFRSARLIVADFTKLSQSKIINRLIISIPIFILAFTLTQVKFDIVWRYMFWFNQVLATIVLWTITVYLAKKKKLFWIALIPSIFMTAVVSTYIFISPEAIGLNHRTSYIIGLGFTLAVSLYFFYHKYFLWKK